MLQKVRRIEISCAFSELTSIPLNSVVGARHELEPEALPASIRLPYCSELIEALRNLRTGVRGPMQFIDGRCHGLRNCILLVLSITTILAALSFAQTIRVDSNPSHVAKTFVPTEALGAGIDRINTSATDKLFTDPVMKQVLSAGWQTVSYRQNTELFIEAWHSHVERSGRPRLFRWQPQAGRFYSAFVRLQPSASRFHA